MLSPSWSHNDVQKLAVKHVRDAYTRHDKWHLVAFLKEVGCAGNTEQEPVSKSEFERVKDNGLRALHPANQQGRWFRRQMAFDAVQWCWAVHDSPTVSGLCVHL